MSKKIDLKDTIKFDVIDNEQKVATSSNNKSNALEKLLMHKWANPESNPVIIPTGKVEAVISGFDEEIDPIDIPIEDPIDEPPIEDPTDEPIEPPVTNNSNHLILFNFRIVDQYKNRIFFDSNKPMSGTHPTGFKIGDSSGGAEEYGYVNEKVLSLYTSNTMKGHFVTLDKSLTWWDNRAIRYEGGSDIKCEDGAKLIPFTLEYIRNDIQEPSTSNTKWIAPNASGSGNSESDPMSLRAAFKEAASDTTYNWKAGDYGAQIKLEIPRRVHDLDKPCKFVGYKYTPGDITSNYWDLGDDFEAQWESAWDVNEMPTMKGNDYTSDHFCWLYSACQGLIFRNFQFSHYHKGIRSFKRNKYMVFDNWNCHTIGGGNNTGSHGLEFVSYDYNEVNGFSGEVPYIGLTDFKITNHISINVDMAPISISGCGRHLLKNIKTYCSNTTAHGVQDYHTAVGGHNNIIVNCRAENFNRTTHHTSHGIGIRGASNRTNTYNVIQDCKAINVLESFYVRNFGCNYNVIKRCYATNNYPPHAKTIHRHSGITFWGGADYNIAEDCTVEYLYSGILLRDIQEEPNVPETTIGAHNIVRNVRIKGCNEVLEIRGSVREGSPLNNTRLLNLTVDDCEKLSYTVWAHVNGLHWKNCNFSNIKTGHSINVASHANETFENCNFWNNGFEVNSPGNGNMSVDPNYINDELDIPENSPLKTAGQVNELVPYNTDGVIGAFKY